MSELYVLNNSQWAVHHLRAVQLFAMKPILKKTFITVIFFYLLAMSNTILAAENSAVALMYHHVGESSHPSTNIRLEQFEQHLLFLEQNGFQVLPLDSVLKAIQNNKPLPKKSVVITMDDAYRSVYSEAYPRLKQRDWPFTVFVSSGYIDKGYSNYMSWQQMREMELHGASFGNHSRSHDHLIRRLENETETAWQQRISDDITYAQQRLRNELKNPIDIIAYPYGEYNLTIANITQQLGLIGMGQHSGAIGPTSDFRFLPRFPMNENFGEMDGFKNKVMSLAMPLEKTPQIDPVISEARPTLNVKLKQPLTLLTCYASGQGKIQVQWLDEKTFTVQAPSDLPAGRSRYNCTAPATKSERFYWFSQLWIRPGGIEVKD